jgi:hypothetical protein
MWRPPWTSRYSYPRVVVIWIDVYRAGKTRYTRHVCFSHQSTYVTRKLPTGGPRTWQHFMLTQQSWTDSLLPRKSTPNSTSQPSWVARGTCLSFSPKRNQLSSALETNIYWRTCYIGLLNPYHQHVINTFHTCSRGPTHRSLTDTGGGYSLGGADLPYHTPRPSQPMVLHFPHKDPARSQVN